MGPTRLVRRTAQRALKTVAAVVPAPAGVVVLIYHRVGVEAGEMAVSTATFAEHLRRIGEGRGPATLDAAADSLAGTAATTHPVVVTFDDGTADIVDHALPLLVERNVPMTLYVATKFVEDQLAFPADGTPISWAGLRECLSTGLVTIGSHTHSHALLDRADPSVASDEIDRSVKLIEDRLGVTPAHFAYPKALLGNEAAQAIVRQRFRTAVIAGTRANRPGRTDLHRIHRSPVQRSDGPDAFEAKLAGRMRLEDDVRRMANRLRYRGART